ncbi:MAG: chloride channel protein [Candidatus Andeanibacterium colombiense]|uniref:Chloride channel protein n=1 Tax=Candidatus Andeanibacterium colombiense TaxID=3121345 RepID=A0AAJ5X9R4_9SPHN|nr:MAG: chloride channel protein [Sphingomonadaceae bacterium]
MKWIPPIGRAAELEPAQWRRRLATLIGALGIGVVALLFARAGDLAQTSFGQLYAAYPYACLILTPAVFGLVAWLTGKIALEARGSGIPQVIAAARNPAGDAEQALVSLRAGVAKLLLTVAALFGGAPVGREGPTVQLGAAIMVAAHRWLRVPVSAGVLIAGGAAGVAAAFNTPLAGIAFAIEELAVAYEQRVAVMAMGAVMIAGLTSQGIAGDYIYFGQVTASLPLGSMLIAAPLAGIAGGALGGLFSRLFIALRGPGGRWTALLRRHPVIAALICGIVVAGIGFASKGQTWGTGYEPTRAMLAGEGGAAWFGPAKFVAALATAASAIPGGIFAPSLSIGAGFGGLLAPLFQPEQAGAIVLLGMAGYFTGVVRAPLTAIIILAETTNSSAMILPLFATALIADWAGGIVCKERLYHHLAKGFLPEAKAMEQVKPEPLSE